MTIIELVLVSTTIGVSLVLRNGVMIGITDVAEIWLILKNSNSLKSRVSAKWWLSESVSDLGLTLGSGLSELPDVSVCKIDLFSQIKCIYNI